MLFSEKNIYYDIQGLYLKTDDKNLDRLGINCKIFVLKFVDFTWICQVEHVCKNNLLVPSLQ